MAKPYDSILKEVFDKVAPEMATNVLHIPWDKTEELKDKTQVTEEREADYLKKLLYLDPSQNCIFQVEFHLRPADLRSWMLLQRGLQRYKYGLPSKQVVFYIGNQKKPKFPNEIKEDNLYLKFEVVLVRDLPFKVFFNSLTPEMVMLSILTNFGGRPPEEIIPEILKKLRRMVADDGKFQQLVVQLLGFSKLRKLQALTIKLIQTMPFDFEYYLFKDTPVFKKGKQEGKLEGKREAMREAKRQAELEAKREAEKFAEKFVTYLLKEGKLSVEKIANLAGVPVSFVHRIQKKLKLESNGNQSA